MGMKLPENSLPDDEAVELLGRVKLHPRFMKLESCRGAIFRIPFGGGEGSWQKNTDMLHVSNY